MIAKSIFLIIGIMTTQAFANVLEGTWKTECVFIPKKHSAMNEIKFSMDRYIAKTTLFATLDCQTENLSVLVKGVFNNTKTSDFHHVPDSVEMVLKSQAVVDYYNKNSVCGISDWLVGQSREVSGKFCNPYEMPKAEQMSFDIFQVKDSILSFGGFPKKTFPNKNDQPTETSTDWTYSKIQ
jgi:hypothetical protein